MGGSNSEEAIDLGDYCLTLGPGSAQWSIVIVIVIVFSTIVIIVVKLLLLHRLKISPYPNTEWAPMWTQTQCVPTLANVAILLCTGIHRIIKHRLMLVEAGHCCRQLWERKKGKIETGHWTNSSQSLFSVSGLVKSLNWTMITFLCPATCLMITQQRRNTSNSQPVPNNELKKQARLGGILTDRPKMKADPCVWVKPHTATSRGWICSASTRTYFMPERKKGKTKESCAGLVCARMCPHDNTCCVIVGSYQM